MTRIRQYGYMLAGLLMVASTPLYADFSKLEAPSESQGAWSIESVQEADNAAYFQALQSSQGMLFRTLGWGWPTGKLTLETNLDTLRFYIEQRQNRRAYSYVVRDSESRRLHGAVFVNPVQTRRGVPGFRAADYAMEVTFWLDKEALESSLNGEFINQLTNWLSDEWQVGHVVFPISYANHYAREQLEQANLSYVADDANNRELLYRFDAR